LTVYEEGNESDAEQRRESMSCYDRKGKRTQTQVKLKCLREMRLKEMENIKAEQSEVIKV
jgi:hypothetical protein